ncbi:ABC transporter substrate-binding protein [Undibacterium sp. SXout7W]|uniref:ABC transporter substrate-binding protein n=1 Tax=Undibacterium sp. SXout7W TaxID=3413049 RepID=UPI003BF32F78
MTHFTPKATRLLRVAFIILLTLTAITLTTYTHAQAGEKPPVLIGLDGEFGHSSSTSAEAIKQGILLAAEEINQRGGVLGGRPLQLIERANHSVPARSIANIREFATIPELVAVYCGRFSPTVLSSMPTIHELGIPLLDPWAAADDIVDNGYFPNYVFRLSLKDSWAALTMIDYLERKGIKKIGLMMLNTSWGRSTKKAAEAYLKKKRQLSIVDTQWINWDDKQDSMLAKIRNLKEKGAQAILLTANAEDAEVLSKALLSLPENDRLPVASHWGVTGGDLPKLVGPRFFQLDFAVVQTFSFLDGKSAKISKIVADHNKKFGSKSARDILSPVGVAHAYDLTHILAQAINQAGSTDRKAIRTALENLKYYDGLIRTYNPPFTAKRHEALELKNIFMARYAPLDGALEKIFSQSSRANK